MISKVFTNGILNALKNIIIFSLILYFFYLIRPILIYLSISLIITIILKPLISFLKTRLKFNNSIAAITSMSGLILIIGLLIKSFIPLLTEQARNLSLLNSTELQTSVNNIIEKYSGPYFNSDSNFINSIISSRSILTGYIMIKANLGRFK